ncbi:MAG: barstar family protein [Janthinobacterium lividum]
MSDAVTEGPGAWPRAGVHRVLGPPAAVVAELAQLAGRGWDVALVPPSTTDAELWDGLVDVLGLPGWFGRNLDALDEALRDLVRPTALVLAGWTAYARARPERWAGLLHVLRDRAEDADPPFVVLLADQGRPVA